VGKRIYMNYSEYISEKWKFQLLQLGGITVMFLGVVVGAWNGLNSPFLSVTGIGGTSIMLFGAYLFALGLHRKSKFYFEREEGNKYYVMEGKFR